MHKSRPLFNCSSADLDSFLGTFIKAKDQDNFIKVLYELSIRNSKYTKKIFDKYNNDIQIFIRSFILQKENEFPKPIKLGRRAIGWHQQAIEEWKQNLERGHNENSKG